MQGAIAGEAMVNPLTTLAVFQRHAEKVLGHGLLLVLLAACVACQANDKAFVQLSNKAVESLKAEDYTRAEAYLRDAIKLKPNDPDAHYYLGTLAFRQNRAKEAVEHLELAAAADPQWPDAQLALAKALVQEKRLKDALTALHALFAVDKGQPNGHLLAAKIAQESGVRSQVDEELRAAIAGDCTFVPAYVMLSHLYSDVGAYEPARLVLEEGLKFTPDSPELQEGLGLAWLDLGRPDRAQQALENASHLPRARYAVYLNLAAADLQLGDKEAAKQALRTYLVQGSGQKADDPQLQIAAKMLNHLKAAAP